MQDYDKDNINPRIIDAVRKAYIANPDFTPVNAAKASSAAEGLCRWVCAMDQYEKVAKVVAPKRASLAIAEGEYNEVKAALDLKQAELKVVRVQPERKHRERHRSMDLHVFLCASRDRLKPIEQPSERCVRASIPFHSIPLVTPVR